MTREEREAMSIGKALVKAIVRMERYNGDPSDILEEAKLSCKQKGVREVVEAIAGYYEGIESGIESGIEKPFGPEWVRRRVDENERGFGRKS